MTYTPTAEDVLNLRRRTGETSTESSYSDGELEQLLVNHGGDIHAAAYDIWSWKAAEAYADIDWSADGGDYKQSVLYERCLQMAEAEKAQSPTLRAMVIDPTLKKVDE
jgi:hypothetical protein